MPSLDEILESTPQAAPLHPRLRHWKERLEKLGESASLEVFRPAAELGMSPSEMYLHFVGTEANNSPHMESVAWDDELNAGLLLLGIRAIDAANESERFALGLRASMRKAAREFGDGYFNSVLHDLVRGSGLAQNPEIADILKHAAVLDPHREGRGYAACREMIADGIAGRMYELREKLKYDAVDAKAILVAALARYLDERFSVSSRRQLGLL